MVCLASTAEAVELAAYLRKLVRYDRGAAVRLLVAGGAFEVYGQPPFEVISMRSFPLRAEEDVDATVSAAELMAGIEGESVAVPSALAAVAWAGVLPPRTGWQQLASAPATSVVDAVLEGVAAFRSRTINPAGGSPSRQELDVVAADVWARPVLAGVPLRAAHAAYSLGLLDPAGEANVDQAGSWLRLAGTYGSVALRRSDRPSLRLA